jgi:imidazolonepropionase-like amidohydrolase
VRRSERGEKIAKHQIDRTKGGGVTDSQPPGGPPPAPFAGLPDDAARGHRAGGSIAITGGYVVPVEGEPIHGGTVLIVDGKIAAVGGPDLEPPPGVEVRDASGRWVLPGLVDAHTHLGAREEGEGWAGHDTNELTGPVQAHVRVLDAINPADEGFRDAIAGGVLAAGVTPGSGNPIGGQTVAIRCWGRTVDDMLLRSPAGMKSALGENPKRVAGQPVQPARHRRGDPQRAGRRARLPGERERSRPGRAVRTGAAASVPRPET